MTKKIRDVRKALTETIFVLKEGYITAHADPSKSLDEAPVVIIKHKLDAMDIGLLIARHVQDDSGTAAIIRTQRQDAVGAYQTADHSHARCSG